MPVSNDTATRPHKAVSGALSAHQTRSKVFGANRARRASREPRSGGPEGVQKHTDNSSENRVIFAEPTRWERSDWLRQYSTVQRVRLCGMRVGGASGGVQVRRGESGMTTANVLMCGSRLCPVCGRAIAARDREEIEKVLSWWLAHPGARLLFGTLTIRHKLGQDYGDVLTAVQKCWQAATGGRGWVQDREDHGIAHTIRVIEEKWSPKNGWHVHVHVLFLVSDEVGAPLAGQDDLLLRSMFQRWATKAGKLGYGVPSLKGQDLHQVTHSEAAKRMARYFAKQDTDATAGSLAAELTGSADKKGRQSMTAGQILSWAVWGERYVSQLWGGASVRAAERGEKGRRWAAALWREYERGRKNRRIIGWSQGLRDAAALPPEWADAEKVEAASQAELRDEVGKRETLVTVCGSDWANFTRHRGAIVALSEIVATGIGAAELVEWFAAFDVVAELPQRMQFGGEDDGPPGWSELATPF